MPGLWPVAVALSLLILPLAGALAQETAGSNAGKDVLESKRLIELSKPVLYPGNGHYYQLFEDFRFDESGLSWTDARDSAAGMTGPEGRRGRLVIIDNAELYSWILQTFDLKNLYYQGATWIGLRYWCAFRKLTLSDGSEYSPKAFAAWDTPWYRQDGIRCETQDSVPFMGVYIAGDSTQRWRATGYRKHMRFYIVEYYTPKETAVAEVPEEDKDEDKTEAPPQ